MRKPWAGASFWRTFVSTGLTDTASTRTSKSRPDAIGSAISRSIRASGRSMAPFSAKPIAFISVGLARDWRHVRHVEVPREEDPGVLAHFGDEGVHHLAALGLG